MRNEAVESLRAWQGAGHYTQFDGHRIFYRQAGDGPPLVLVHGFPTAGWDFEPLWDRLTARFRVVVPDLLGFGFSDRPAVSYSIALQAHVVEHVARQLEIEHAHLLVHDYGVSVGQELLARHEQREHSGGSGFRVDSLCFLNGGLFPETHRPKLVQRLLASPLGPVVGRVSTKRRLLRTLASVFGTRHPPSPELLEAMWQLVDRDGGRYKLHRLLHYIDDRRRHRERWVAAMQHTKVPLRVINGSDDPISGAHLVVRYRELVPQPDVVELPGVGHWPQLEDPDAVYAAFIEFIEAGPSERWSSPDERC